MRRAVTIVAICSLLCACTAHRTAPRSPAQNETARAAPQELTPDLVLARVRDGYTVGVRRCYTRYLKNRSGHGRVLVSFTVDERGRAQDGAASGVPPKLGNCIVAEVARWRFPAPKVAQSFALPMDLIAD